MSRRKVHRSQKSMYLNPEMEEVNEAVVKSNKRNKKGSQVPVQIPANVRGGTYGNATTGSYGYGTGTIAYESHVHKGLEAIYEYKGKQLFAGNGRGVDVSSGHWDLIIDLASQLPFHNPFGCVKERSAKRFDVLRKYLVSPKTVNSEVLSLDWPDMGIIPATLDFWVTLWNMLPAKTVAMCVGGHGRTGTCLAALMIVSGETYYDTIDIIREKHCTKAIETVSQTRYLHALYMESLKRSIKTAKDASIIAELKEHLDYAEKFVPNDYSDYGEKAPAKEIQAASEKSHSSHSYKSNDDLAQDRLKLIGGKLYEQVCVEAHCQVTSCLKADHQGWIEYEIDDTKADALTV